MIPSIVIQMLRPVRMCGLGLLLLGAVVGQRIALLARAAFLAAELADGKGEVPLLLGESHRVHSSSSVERPLAFAEASARHARSDYESICLEY